MDREAMENLRLDRRLMHRRGWASKAEREKQLDALPDVSHKIAPPEEQRPTETEPAEETVPQATGEPGTASPPREE